MLNKTAIVITAFAFSANIASADMLSDFPSIQNDVNSFMGEELITITNGLSGQPPIIDCGCPHLCAMLGMIVSGRITGDKGIQEGLFTALVTDQAAGINMTIKNGGKFDADGMPVTRVKMKYAKGFDAKALAGLSQEIGKMVLR